MLQIARKLRNGLFAAIAATVLLTGAACDGPDRVETVSYYDDGHLHDYDRGHTYYRETRYIDNDYDSDYSYERRVDYDDGVKKVDIDIDD